jgi:hypothetical protein
MPAEHWLKVMAWQPVEVKAIDTAPAAARHQHGGSPQTTHPTTAPTLSTR